MKPVYLSDVQYDQDGTPIYKLNNMYQLDLDASAQSLDADKVQLLFSRLSNDYAASSRVSPKNGLSLHLFFAGDLPAGVKQKEYQTRSGLMVTFKKTAREQDDRVYNDVKPGLLPAFLLPTQTHTVDLSEFNNHMVSFYYRWPDALAWVANTIGYDKTQLAHALESIDKYEHDQRLDFVINKGDYYAFVNGDWEIMRTRDTKINYLIKLHPELALDEIVDLLKSNNLYAPYGVETTEPLFANEPGAKPFSKNIVYASRDIDVKPEVLTWASSIGWTRELLAKFVAVLVSAPAKYRRLFFITGEAGIGKSEFINYLTQQLFHGAGHVTGVDVADRQLFNQALMKQVTVLTELDTFSVDFSNWIKGNLFEPEISVNEKGTRVWTVRTPVFVATANAVPEFLNTAGLARRMLKLPFEPDENNHRAWAALEALGGIDAGLASLINEGIALLEVEGWDKEETATRDEMFAYSLDIFRVLDEMPLEEKQFLNDKELAYAIAMFADDGTSVEAIRMVVRQNREEMLRRWKYQTNRLADGTVKKGWLFD
jgi:hypothetical protein